MRHHAPTANGSAKDAMLPSKLPKRILTAWHTHVMPDHRHNRMIPYPRIGQASHANRLGAYERSGRDSLGMAEKAVVWGAARTGSRTLTWPRQSDSRWPARTAASVRVQSTMSRCVVSQGKSAASSSGVLVDGSAAAVRQRTRVRLGDTIGRTDPHQQLSGQSTISRRDSKEAALEGLQGGVAIDRTDHIRAADP